MIINWPPSLIADIARRRSVIFLGSGISSQAKNASGVSPKTWQRLLEAARDRLVRNPLVKDEITRLIEKERDYLTACQVIKDAVQEADFHDFLRGEYLSPGFKHAPIHETIMKLDSRLYATPNFDKIFESYMNHEQHGTVIVKQYDEADLAEVVRGVHTVIIKIHGSVDTIHKAIFTRSQYAQARTAQRAFYSILEALAITHTFLFLGCGLNDPDIRLLLEDYAFNFPFRRPHFFVLPNDALATATLSSVESSLNITVLTYDPVNNHEMLPHALDELVAEVEAARRDIQNTGLW